MNEYRCDAECVSDEASMLAASAAEEFSTYSVTS